MHFVEGVKIRLLSLGGSKFGRVKREANSAAHVLEKEVYNHAADSS